MFILFLFVFKKEVGDTNHNHNRAATFITNKRPFVQTNLLSFEPVKRRTQTSRIRVMKKTCSRCLL